MKRFDDIKIRNKLFVVFGILACIMVSFAIFAVSQIVGMADDINELIHSYQARQIHIAEASTDLYRVRLANLTRGYLAEGDDYIPVAFRAQNTYEADVESFSKNLHDFRGITSGDPGSLETERQEHLAVDGIEDAFSAYKEFAGKIDEAAKRKDMTELTRLMAEAFTVGSNLADKVQDLRDMLFSAARFKALETADEATRAINVIIAMAAGFLFLSAFALYITVNYITRPISQLETTVTEIADGNLSRAIRSGRKDELGTLSNCIADMVGKITEYNKTKAIMDNMDSMIYVTDLDRNLLYMNKRLADAFGLNMENGMRHQKCYMAIRNREAACAACQLPALLPRKNSFPSQDFEYIWDEDLHAWIGGNNAVILWADGSLAYFNSMRDVTQKKRHEELLQETLQAAETASLAKSSFLAKMSHEIRTPMSAILGITEILIRNTSLAPDIREGLYKIFDSGELLLNIINQILDLSKIEAGKLELAPVEYQVASLINDSLTLNMVWIGSKHIELELDVDENTPSTLFGDEFRIRQILNNLLSNAFKYTEDGVVKLSVSVEASGKKKGSDVTLVFIVSDTGPGMTEEQVSKLFDEYARFSTKAGQATEGTGLGMSITRNLIRMMNGVIFVESELNRGSVFTVRIPQWRVSSSVMGKALVENLRKFRISEKKIKKAQLVSEPMPHGKVLIVDDVESNLYVAEGLLAPYGISVDTVMSGFEAIEKISKGNIYDIVFMDHMMPKMDGMETTKILREQGYERPIVALTANAVFGQIEMFLANGFDDFISKPIDTRQLNATLKKYIRDKKGD